MFSSFGFWGDPFLLVLLFPHWSLLLSLLLWPLPSSCPLNLEMSQGLMLRPFLFLTLTLKVTSSNLIGFKYHLLKYHPRADGSTFPNSRIDSLWNTLPQQMHDSAPLGTSSLTDWNQGSDLHPKLFPPTDSSKDKPHLLSSPDSKQWSSL